MNTALVNFKLAHKVFTTLALTSVVSTAYLLKPSHLLAQTQGSLTVAPSRQTLTVKPGETTTINIKFINQSDSPISGPLGAADFIVEDKNGTPIFIDPKTQGNLYTTRFAAASWVKLNMERMTVPAHDKINIQAKVTVPENAIPGGRYFALYFEPGANVPLPVGSLEEAGSAVSTRVAGLIYMRIAGPIEEKALLSKFTTPSFIEYGPAVINFDILNRGSYHIRPKGIITLTDMLGRKVDEKLVEEENIFPDAGKSYQEKLGSQLMFGKFTVKYAASYGDTGQILMQTASFWAFPVRLVLAILLGVTAAIMLAIYLTKKMKGDGTKLEETLTQELTEVEELKKKYQDIISEHIITPTPEEKK